MPLFCLATCSDLASCKPAVDCYFFCDREGVYSEIIQCNTTVGCVPPWDCSMQYWTYHQTNCKNKALVR